MAETIIEAMLRYAEEEHQKAADRGLTLAEHYRDLALDAAVAEAKKVSNDANLRWCIENSPGIHALSGKVIADIVAEALDKYHNELARKAVEGSE
ncbi:MAG: hypothetical protein ACOH2N_13360 [Devosia sp.]